MGVFYYVRMLIPWSKDVLGLRMYVAGAGKACAAGVCARWVFKSLTLNLSYKIQKVVRFHRGSYGVLQKK